MVHNPLGEHICLHHLSQKTYPSDGSSDFYSGIHFDISGRSQGDWGKFLLNSRDWTSYDHTLSMLSQSSVVVLGEFFAVFKMTIILK